MNKDIKKVIQLLRAQGFDVAVTKRGHHTVSKDGKYVTTLPGTPSDWRGLKNAIAKARRAGFRWPP